MGETEDDRRAVQRRLLTTLERLLTIQVSETADGLAQAAWGHSTVDPLPPHPITGHRILLVDGDREMRHKAGTYLEMQGYITLHAADAPAAIASLRTALPDLVLLGMTMPEQDSFTVLREIRALSSVPVIVLVVDGDEDQMVQALRLGADDCMARPVSQRELLARIESVLRRTAQAGVLHEDVLVIDEDLTIDFARNRVILRGAARILTATEHRLLHHLVSNAGRLLPFEALLARVWGPDYREEVHYVRLYVSYLRAKIEPIPARPRYILTEKGLGYRFATLPDQGSAAQQAHRASTGLGRRDMQWPVSVITAYSEALLQQPTVSDMGARRSARLVEQATSMLDLADALLDLQHLGSGLLRLEVSNFDLSGLATEVTGRLQATSQTLRLRFDSEDPLPVKADRRRLDWAIASLVENAIQYSPDGSVITVTGRKAQSGNGHANQAVLVVRDQGTGIEASELPHVFECFYQGTGERLHDGMPHLGVGLYVARGIIEQHGGTIRAETSAGQGSTFYLSLPTELS